MNRPATTAGEKREVGGGGTNDEDRGRPDPYLTQYRQAPLSRVSRRHRVHDSSAPRAAQEWGGWLVEQLRPQRKEEAARAPALPQVPDEVSRAFARAAAEPPSRQILAFSSSLFPDSADQDTGGIEVPPEGLRSPTPEKIIEERSVDSRRPSSTPPQPRRRVKRKKRAETPAPESTVPSPVYQSPGPLPAVRIKRRVTADALFDIPFDRALELYPELQSRVDTLTDGQRALWRIRWPERHPQLRELLDYWLPDVAPLERSRVRARPYNELFQEGVFLHR
eukprot:Hpha_TRINITY_DN13144_c0_g1::TRINITY_DN13144_c0_g1_i1::g.113442::m.113442